MSTQSGSAQALAELQPRHPFFVGIDSDGCAFDTMEIKHKECFCPVAIKHWNLQPVSKYAREAWEFVNLYSRWRGINRWPALVMALDLLRERPEVQTRKVEVAAAAKVREFMASGQPLSNDGLKAYRAEHPHPELDQAWAWTTGVNAAIADLVHGVPPFPYLRESLEVLQRETDVVVVSATPGEALVREWEEHDIAKYARVIAGQEMGSKKQHLALAAKGKYPPDRILMIGDAPGDMEAARANGALFFPINPGHEEKSWERFGKEGLGKFMAGEYAGAYEASLVTEFEKLLPSAPPWKR
ncbi:MAG TPA: HAD hydrolase-like protein [Candidatus Methylomirabilis sp.]|nr:HAD hydrolase-like protein [Candidatus Methylomirabilis sp.]